MASKLQIAKKEYESAYKVFSVRIKEQTYLLFETISSKGGRFRNELMNSLLECALEHCEIEEQSHHEISLKPKQTPWQPPMVTPNTLHSNTKRPYPSLRGGLF